MPTDLEYLQQRKATILQRLASLDGGAGDKPNASLDGESVDHVGYRRSLYEELDLINKQIATAEGPWEVSEYLY